MLFVTGDCHGDVRKLGKNFKRNKDFPADEEHAVIVCGDFGLVWSHDSESKEEKWWLDWLNDKPFYTLFVPGNHENYDRLESYPTVEFHGGKMKQIRHKVLMIEHGEIFEFNGVKIWGFGGASSHDIQDGILDPADFEDEDTFRAKWKELYYKNYMFRVKGWSWWPQEIPSPEKMLKGIDNLEKNNNSVDFIVSHCCATSTQCFMGFHDKDALTDYFEHQIRSNVNFKRWYFGHYHADRVINDKEICVYDDIIQIA